MKQITHSQLEHNYQVLHALDEEFAYINSLRHQTLDDGSPRADDNDHGVAGQILTAEKYLGKARTAWVASGSEEAALDNLRKVAATCIRALILYGCPRRELT